MSHTFTTWHGTPDGTVQPKTITRPALTGHQVFVKTTHSGVCGEYLHFSSWFLSCAVISSFGDMLPVLEAGLKQYTEADISQAPIFITTTPESAWATKAPVSSQPSGLK